MPLAGTKAHPRALPEFFRSFAELDEWRAKQSGPIYPAEGVVKFVPRKLRPVDVAGKGKLMVCHDYKGGYVEDPFSKCYSFNWWSSTDCFIYFAHYRITIPPPEWITAAHRQGSTMLGTLIFEGGSEQDAVRMMLGNLPGSQAAAAQQAGQPPISTYYAELLADIAKERGFDGWLLNVEIGLQGGMEQARSLSAWMTILQSEIAKKVGPHGQTAWYDSVTIRGDLWWQDRVNSLNLPFFLQSTGFFTNYWWYNDVPQLQVEYFSKIDPNLTGQTAEAHPQIAKKTVQDIYVGVDVWGRGSHGGGGFGSYKAIEHAAPATLGLSIALFAQGWTWETEENKPGWNWESFWDYDSKLWVGPVSGTVPVEETQYKPGELPCVHGPFVPISNFFPRLPPPDPIDLPFYTNFSPGIGDAWFVKGKKVFQSAKGWTDIDKQTNVGDLVWPKPTIYRLETAIQETEQPTALPRLNFTDAWNGGNSLQINVTVPGSSTSQGAFWLPIQSLNLTARRVYEAIGVYKVGLSGVTPFEARFELGIRAVTGAEQATIIATSTTDLNDGWKKMTIQFEMHAPPPAQGGSVIVPSSIGFIIAVATKAFTAGYEFPFLVGQLSVHPYLPPTYRELTMGLLWVTFQPETAVGSLNGTLAWEVVAALDAPPPLDIIDPNDTRVPWDLQPTKQEWYPNYLYFNIYAQQYTDSGTLGELAWIGTTGFDGVKKKFFVQEANLPYTSGPKRYNFKIQGVLDTGEVSSWGDSVSLTSAGAELKKARRTSLKPALNAVLHPLRRRMSKGEVSLAK